MKRDIFAEPALSAPALPAPVHVPLRVVRPSSPWPWQKHQTSVAVLTSPQGQHWIRVQHADESQKLVPWPAFEGWETALPPAIGVADPSLGAIAVHDIVEAIRILQGLGFGGPVAGAWQVVLPRRGAGPPSHG